MSRRKKLPARIEDDYTIKVIILFLLRELKKPLSFQTLSEIIIWDEKVNYFVFTSCLADLTDRGAVSVKNEGGGDIYSINELGLELLKEVEDSLLDSVKARMLRSATRLFAYNRSGSVINSQVIPDGNGYKLICTVKDNKFDLMELKIYVDSTEEAQFLKNRFDEKAELVYRGVIALLSGDADLLV